MVVRMLSNPSTVVLLSPYDNTIFVFVGGFRIPFRTRGWGQRLQRRRRNGAMSVDRELVIRTSVKVARGREKEGERKKERGREKEREKERERERDREGGREKGSMCDCVREKHTKSETDRKRKLPRERDQRQRETKGERGGKVKTERERRMG